MSSNSKRWFSALFGIHLSEDPPKLESLVPARISADIMNGKLPVFHPSTLFLEPNETCHFMDRAALVCQVKENGSISKRYGGTNRSLLRSFFGDIRVTRPFEQSWTEYKEGIIFVTNKRIVFIEPNNGFEEKISRLTTAVPYEDAIVLQFGKKHVALIVSDSQLIHRILKLIYGNLR